MKTPPQMSMSEMANKVDTLEFLMIVGCGAVAALAGFIGLSYLTSSPVISSALGLTSGLFVSWQMFVMTANLPEARPAEDTASHHRSMSAAESRCEHVVLALMVCLVCIAISLVLAATIGQKQYRSSGAAELEYIVAQFPNAQTQAAVRRAGESAQACFEMGYKQAGMWAVYGAMVPGPGLIQEMGAARMKHCLAQRIQAVGRLTPSGN